jgi:hypothetical protein
LQPTKITVNSKNQIKINQMFEQTVNPLDGVQLEMSGGCGWQPLLMQLKIIKMPKV